MLEIKKETHGDVIVISLNGKLDALNAFELKPEIDDVLAAGIDKVVFDLTHLSLIDSSGVGAIVSVYKRTRAQNGDTRIANLSKQPREVFNILSLHKAIRIFDSVDEAVDSFH